MKNFFVANWKMYLTFKEELDFVKTNLKELNDFGNENNIILSPSFISIHEVHKLLKNSNINLAAQNCSDKEIGPYTGEISAESIKQSGAAFCIVGHSENRKYFNETDEIIASKIQNLITKEMIPILCIGETEKEYKSDKTVQTLKRQLNLIIQITNFQKIIIAYEPIWSIGTGVIPKIDHLDEIIQIIKEVIKEEIPVLYGGSINSKNIDEFKKSKEISGFLIGKASTDFQEFKKIVKSY